MKIRYSGMSDTGFCAALTLLCAICPLLASAQTDPDTPVAWPRELAAEQGKIVIYQPQLESFQADRIEARAAVSVTPTGQTVPVFGACWFEARVATDFDTREVSLLELKVTAAKFPEVEEQRVAQLSRFLEEEIPQWDMTFSLDRLLASLETAEVGTPGSESLKHDPPEIIYVTHPAVLVLIDGAPQMAQLENSDLKYVVNTAFYIVQDPGTQRFCLKGGDHWFTAEDLLGTWQVTSDLPKAVAQVAQLIAEEERRQAAEQAEQGVAGEDTEEAEELGEAGIPEIIVRTRPAELLQVNGEPEYAPIPDTGLLYLQNTESDIVLEVASQQHFVLISGRWYASRALGDADWVFVPNDQLPAEFAKIPGGSDMGQVRASVAGTQEAREAVLENQIPQTAEVDRRAATVTVTYDGDPQFEKCGDAGVAYALNTDKSVLLIDGRYYCCDNAVWFFGQGPEGPWAVCTEVPAEVQTLPPECPVYNIKYVYIYESTPEVVYVGYTPGYLGSYYYGGCVVWGTGWWYHPWYRTYYYPRPVTWGFHVHYNPITGWGFTYGVSAGWLHIGVGRPWYGGWWGPAGYRHGYRHGYHQGYRHGYHQGARAGYRAGYRAGQNQAQRNIYRTQRPGVRSARPERIAQNRTRQQVGRDGPAASPKTPKQSRQKNDVYTDRSGNVYRDQGDQWQKRDKGGWSTGEGRAGSQRDQQNLNRDRQARQRGDQRANQSRSARSGARTGSSSGSRGGGRR